MSTGDPNYIIIRRAIFGKVHGDGVKEIWLISQFPAKHTGVASGAKIVFARPGLTRFSGYGHAVINNEVIIFIVCSPQSDCISLFWDPSVTFWPSRMVRSVNKKSREKHRHFSLYVQNISGCREKKELKIPKWNVISNFTCYEKIQGELQNTCKNEKENRKQLSVQIRVKRLIASRGLNLIEVVHFTSVAACSSLSF